MNKVAIVELGTMSTKLIMAYSLPNDSFIIFDQAEETVRLAEDIGEDGIIKTPRVKEVVNALKTFKALCDTNEITEVIAVTTKAVREAKNQKSFLEEMYNQSGFSFKVLTEEEQLKGLYTATINTLDVPKGLIIEISGSSVQLMHYNRRNLLNQASLNFGSLTMVERFSEEEKTAQEISEEIVKLTKEEIAKIEWLNEVEPEFKIVGVGETFTNIAKISQKIKKYPLDHVHAYELDYTDFNKVYDLVKGLNLDKTKKLKGISASRADVLAGGVAIAKAFMSELKTTEDKLADIETQTPQTLIINKNSLVNGILFNKTVSVTNEKPITDILGYSLDVIVDYYNARPSNHDHVYNLSMILFKQLKVLHKLSRTYVKVLRVASKMFNSGKRINFHSNERSAFNLIVNSEINGLTHRELVLSAFVATAQNTNNLKLVDWVKYKNLFNEEDLIAVRRLAVIVKIASALDRFQKRRVIDINCDILGDSVIMKTILDGKAVLEIREARKTAEDFKKAFNRSEERR